MTPGACPGKNGQAWEADSSHNVYYGNYPAAENGQTPEGTAAGSVGGKPIPVLPFFRRAENGQRSTLPVHFPPLS